MEKQPEGVYCEKEKMLNSPIINQKNITMKKQLLMLMFLAALLVPWTSRAQLTVEIGDGGTTTNSYLPMYTLYNNTLSEQIYTAAEIGMPGNITSVSFYNGGSTKTVSAKIYMINTTRTDFSSTTDWLPVTANDLYFDGSVTFTAGQWTTITLTNPFMYDGSSNLGLIFDGNLNWSSGLACRVFNSTSNCAMYVYSDGTDYNAVGATYSANSRLDVKNQLQLTILPADMSCAWPINVAVSGIDSAEATLSWGDTTGATAWRVYWAPADSAALIDSVDVTDSTYTFTGLNANTLYNVSVMTVCDTSTSIAMGTSFRTLCGINATPFTEGFEGRTSGDVPFCWTQFATGTSGSGTFPSIYNYATNAHTGSNYFEFESSTGQTEIAVLPTIENISNLRLRFYAACTNNNFVLEAGVMEDTTFVVVDTVTLTAATSFGNSAYQEYAVYYNNYNGTGNRMALRTTAAGSYTLMIDDLTVEEIPGCPDPTYFTVDSVGTDWAALSWVENGSASSWYIEYDTVPFTPGANTAAFSENATDTYITLTDLDTGYTYYVYMHADCGGDTSNNVFLQFNTLAGDPATVPYECTFEGGGVNGWEFANEGQTNYWMIGSATSNGGNQSMYITNDGQANAYTNNSTSNAYAFRVFNFTDTGEYAYSFDWKAQGESCCDYGRAALMPGTFEPVGGNTTFAVAAGTNVPGAVADLTSGARLNVTSNWTTISGTFRISTPGTYKMVFFWHNDGSVGTMPPVAIDNVQLVRNSCPQVQNLAATYVSTDSITVSWSAGGSETEWEIRIGNEDPVVVTTTTYTFDELYANTPYTIFVRAICSADDSSMASTLNVRTACGPMTLPFNEDFESYTTSTGATGVTPACWEYTMTNSSYSSSSYVPQVYQTSTSYYHHSGAYSLRLYGVGYTVLPVIPDDVDMNQLSMSFWSMRTSTSYNMMVGVMTHPDSLDSFDTIMVVNYPGTSAMYNFEIDFSNYTGTGRYIAFKNYYGTTGYSYHYIDDISVWRNSTCATPTYVNVTGVSNDVATVNWGEVDTANYDDVVVYWATINNINAADSVVINDGSTSTLLTGLTGSTTYYVWVKGECTDEPSRAITTSFTTTPDCVPVQNLTVAGVDYHAFGLQWEAPTAGHPATAYIVSWKHNDATAWQSDTVNTTYYYINGLGLDSLYQYRVTTICDTIASSSTSGSVRTLGCGDVITSGGTTYSYLPTNIYYGYSYTQQIYLDEELANVDTISSIAFQVDGNASARPIVLYLGNTQQASFSSTGNYIPADSLTQVFSGTLSGSGWITLTLTTPFIRQAGSNLVVAMDDNTGSYTSTTYWVSTSTSTARGLYFYQDGNDILPASPSANNSAAVNYVNQILIAGPTCIIPTCGRPIVFVSNISTNSADITWNTETGLTYEVAYQQVGDTAWTIVDAANTTGTASINGLTPAFDWSVRVSTSCNGVELSGSSAFATLCGPVALPYTENFENVDYGIFNRSCWVNGSTNLGSTYPNPYVISLTGDPNKLCLIYQGGYLIMPEMDAPLNELQIRFKFVQGGDNVHFLLGLMQNPELPITAIHVLDTLIRSEIDTTNTTVYITYSFANIDTAYNHARITFWDAFADNYNFIDDVVVEYIPQCSPASDFSVSATDNSAAISWNVNGTNGTSYIVEYGPHNFTPGTGTTVTGAASPINLTGLNHSTSYDAYIYTVCGGFGDTSIASPVVMFTTECAPITTLPYTTNFENILPAGSGSSVVMVPNCWATESASGTAPRIYYTTTLDYAPSQSHALYFYNEGVVALPEMGMPLDSLMVSFHDYNPTPGTYGLVIGAVDSITPGFAASFQPIDTIPFELGVNSYNVVSFLSDYIGSANHIAIKNYNAAGNTYATHYIDDLTIDVIPSCIAPQRVRTTALTNVSADLEWRISQAPSYSVEYGVHGFTPGTGTTVTTTTRSVSLTGLTPFTTYDVRLVSLCSATETSDTTLFSFTTLRAAPVTSYPYVCDFADSAEANAWEPINGTQTNQWYLGTTAHYGTADSMGYYVTDNGGTSNNYSGSASHTYVYRTFSFNPGSYNIAFKWQCNGEGSTTYAYDYMRAYLVPVGSTITVGQAPDGGTSSYSNAFAAPQAGWIALGGNTPLRGQSTWQSFNEDVTITTAGNYNLVFYWGNDGSVYNNPAGAFDNVEIYLNTCPAPAEIFAASAGMTNITIDWVDLDTTFVAWNVEYGPAGYTRGSSAGTSMTVTSHPVAIAGLDTLTAYDFYVQPICSGNDTGRWSAPSTLSTAICDGATIATSYGSGSASTTNYGPIGYSCYNYSYVQTIIDSAQMANIGGEITAFSFLPVESASSYGSYFTSMNVYMANVSETVLSSVIVPDSNHVFEHVITNGNFNFTDDTWQTITFDTAFTWDGHSNVLFAVNRGHGSYSCSAEFSAHSGTGNKMLCLYNDDYAYNVNNPSTVDGYSELSNTVGDLQLISCGGCTAPVISGFANITYESAIVNVTGNSESYELNYGTDPSNMTNNMTSTTGTFTLTNLTPATQYFFQVRQECEEGEMSNWTEGFFVTDSLPCMPVSGLTVAGTGYESVTLTWTSVGNETAWEVIVYNTVDTFTYEAAATTYEATGLTSGVTYNANVRPLCGSNHNIEGDWFETPVNFTTDICQPVTGVSVTEVGGTTATISWTAPAEGSGSYRIEYGYAGFDRGQGQSATATGTTYTIEGLESQVTYDVYVANICTESLISVWSDVTTFETTNGQGIADVDAEGNLSIYPNPASAMVTISVSEMLAGAEVAIVDLNGRTVMTFTLNGTNGTFDVSKLGQGAYFVRLTGEQATTVRKLIVK